MNITLSDFKYYSGSKSFELPEKGLILLSGRIGTGKSTLLQSIVYAFFGKIRKPYTHGKSGCMVELVYNGVTITRTSRPNRLVVIHEGTTYEDEAAQGVINSLLGTNYSEFMASSYIIQRKTNSIISMTPSEKTKFIEILAFNDDKHVFYKQMFKNHKLECKDDVTRSEGSLRMLSSQLKKMSSDIVEINVQENINPKKIRKEEAKLKEKLKKAKRNLQSSSRVLDELLKEENTKTDFIAEKNKIDVIVSQLQQKLQSMPKRLSETEITTLEEQCDDVKAELTLTEKYKEHQKAKKLAEELLNEHTTSVSAKNKVSSEQHTKICWIS